MQGQSCGFPRELILRLHPIKLQGEIQAAAGIQEGRKRPVWLLFCCSRGGGEKGRRGGGEEGKEGKEGKEGSINESRIRRGQCTAKAFHSKGSVWKSLTRSLVAQPHSEWD